MKLFKKILLVFTVTLFTLGLTACSKFGSVKNAFEKAGWEYAENEDGGSIVKGIVADLENGELTINVHVFKYGFSTATVIEFGSDKELKEAMNKSETLKGFLKDIQESDYVNGNCILLTLNSKALEIFKDA